VGISMSINVIFDLGTFVELLCRKNEWEVLDVYVQQGSTYSGLLAAARGGSAISGDNGQICIKHPARTAVQ
jgi:hypothetical protein